MARIYQTRNLIDPNMFQYVGNRADQNVAYANKQTERNANAVSNILKPLGGLADMGIRAYETRDLLEENDPTLRAAREEYIRTGSTGPLMNYQFQKMTADQRAADAKRVAEEKANADAFHKAVRIAQARPEYAKIQKSMLDAVDSGDMESANILQKQLQAYETEFGTDTFGQDSASILAARQESAKKAQNLAIAEAADKREQEEKEAKSYDVKNWIIENIIPLGAIKSKNEQIEIADFIRNSKGLTDADRKELLDRVNAGKTQEEKITETVQTTVAEKAGEKVGKKIDETTNKANAKKYDGKTLVGADWKSIPDDEKKYLSRDASGVVKYIGG